MPDLASGKGYSDFKLMKKDWEQIKKVHEVLKVLITNTIVSAYLLVLHRSLSLLHSHSLLLGISQSPEQSLSSSSCGSHGRIWRSFLSSMRCGSPLRLGLGTSRSGIAKLTIQMFTLCALVSKPVMQGCPRSHADAVLNPNYKNVYAENNWDGEYYQAGMVRLRTVFDLYYVWPAAESSSSANDKSKGNSHQEMGEDLICLDTCDKTVSIWGYLI